MSTGPDKLAIASWSSYDFANTIFSMNVISLYFALWVTVDKGGDDILYSLALSGSMLAVAVTAPVFGTLSDRTGKKRGPLALLTVLCIAATAAIGLADNLVVGLLLFSIANYGYQSAMVFYNSMLPDVAKGSHIGVVSGYGVALGYLGSIAGLLMVKPFVADGGRIAAFVPTAIMFLLFALPCLLLVKDPESKNIPPDLIKNAFRTLRETLSSIGRYKILLQFIFINFLVMDVVHTIVAFMSIYANKVVGFNDAQISTFLIISTVFAMIGSYIIGLLVKMRGSIFSYWLVLWLWVSALLMAVWSQTEFMFWVVGPLAGMGLGGVWVVSRAFLVELCPAEKIGEFFGIYGLAGKMAAILGPLLWGTVVLIFDATQTFKYRAAVFALLQIMLVACLLFRAFTRRVLHPVGA